MRCFVTSSILLFSLAFPSVLTAPASPSATPSPPICNSTITINPPNDLTKPYYWPTGWNENLDPPPHNIDLQCSFLFNVPKGLYARLVMNGDVGRNADLLVNDNTGYIESEHAPHLDPYFFTHGTFNVTLVSQRIASVGTLGIKVVWSNFPSATPSKMKITNGTIHFHHASDAQHGVVFTTDIGSKVSLVPIPNSSVYYNQSSLRNTLVFDGPSYHSNYVGNLLEIFYYGNQLVSTGNSLTVLTFEPQNTKNMYVIQDYRDTIGFSAYTSLTCDDSGKCHALLDSKNGRSAAVSVSMGGETLVDGNVDYDGTLSVYSGVISKSNLLDVYNYTTIGTNLPHSYPVYIRQYVNDIGLATVVTSRKMTLI